MTLNTQAVSEKIITIEVLGIENGSVTLLIWEQGERPLTKNLAKGDSLEVTHTLRLDQS